MPYSVTAHKAVICPPKCGTTSIQAAFVELGLGKEAPDHMRMSEMLRDLKANHGNVRMQWAMNVRNPFDRLVSGVRSLASAGHQFDSAMEQCVNDASIVFKPQIWFLDKGRGNVVTLFNFETMDIVRWLGWEGTPPHRNASKTHITPQQVMDHRWYEDAMKRYEDDWMLWEVASHCER